VLGASEPAPAQQGDPNAPPVRGSFFWDVQDDQPAVRTIGSIDPRTGYRFQLETVNAGAAVRILRLSEHFQTAEDKQAYQRDPNEYLRRVRGNPDAPGGNYRLLTQVSANERTLLPLATRTLRVTLSDLNVTASFDLSGKQWRFDPEGSSVQADHQTLRFYYPLRYGPSADDSREVLRLVKTYWVGKGDYSVRVKMTVENLWEAPIRVALDQLGPTGLIQEDPRQDRRRGAYARWNPADNQVNASLPPIKEMPLTGRSDIDRPFLWAGQVNKFFASAIYLVPGDENALAATSTGAEFYLDGATQVDPRYGQVSETLLAGVRVGVSAEEGVAPTLRVQPGQSRTFTFDVFAGPKRRELFTDPEAAGYRPLYQRLAYMDLIDLSGCVCAIDSLTLLMMWLLEKLSVLALGNYGVAIILLVCVVRLLLHPLTKRSQVSMMKMQKLGPEIQKVKEKYADDKAAQQQEMMKVYKQAGATPLLGCLPMFLQMPIWIGLFTSINASVQLRHAAFLPFWLTDLATPDQLISWSQDLPLIGHSFNLLPVLLTVAMALQQKFNPQMNAQAATASPEQQTQQKIMKILFPGMMLVFFYKAPSGLTLYIMASTFAGVAEQYVIRKHIKEREAEEAGSEITIEAPGKAARGKRPKKDKNPFRIKNG
jgi:YidC/Oxa1 family membrane protein insertase